MPATNVAHAGMPAATFLISAPVDAGRGVAVQPGRSSARIRPAAAILRSAARAGSTGAVDAVVDELAGALFEPPSDPQAASRVHMAMSTRRLRIRPCSPLTGSRGEPRPP